MYVKHTGLPLDQIERSMERDTFMGPAEAQTFGIIDKILTSPPKNKSGNEDSEQTSVSETSQEKKWLFTFNLCTIYILYNENVLSVWFMLVN